MKKLLLILAGAFPVLSSNAQITITLSSYGALSFPKTDTIYGISNLSAVSSLGMGSASWDLTSAVYSTDTGLDYYTKPNPAFPAATFGDSVLYPINANLDYISTLQESLTANGYLQIGEHVTRQAIGIGSVTGSSTDSLVFPDQIVTYTGGDTVLKFPLTSGTSWSSTTHFTTNFNVTISVLSLVKTPAQRVSTRTYTGKVIGYGKMTVNHNDKTHSGAMDVLMVKVKDQVVDSFYLGGAPAPATLLAGFGLSQGMTTPAYSYYFYRVGEITPLAVVDYGTDSTYATPQDAFVHTQRLAAATDVYNVAVGANSVSVYPNPVNGNTINFEALQGSGNWTYKLTNVMGQCMASGNLPLNNNHGQINLSADMAAGTYYLSLQNNGQVYTKTVSITK